MQFIAVEKGIEVNGQTVRSVLDGMGRYQTIGENILSDCGIGDIVDGKYTLDDVKWYSQEAWLKAFEQIAQKIGESTLKKIGKSIPNNAKFPPSVVDIDTAIQSIDVAYHMNHRKREIIMYDGGINKMTEGIGHYGYLRIPDKKMIVCECANPYPCSFDLGIVQAMAQKFEITANVRHDKDKPCRKDGAESCTYIVTW